MVKYEPLYVGFSLTGEAQILYAKLITLHIQKFYSSNDSKNAVNNTVKL